MKQSIIKYTAHVLLLMSAASFVGCKKDYTDPSRATEDKVFSSASGLTAVSVGLQRDYALGRGGTLYSILSTNGLVTKEIHVLNPGNLAEFQVETGGTSVDGTNTMLAGLWSICNKIVYDADRTLAGAAALPDKSYASGIIGYATIFKALAIGDMAMMWEKVPDGTGINVNFITSTEGFNKAIAAINDAQTAIGANAISASFLANIPAGVDIPNTLNALKARFSLFTGNYTQALAAANAVDLTKKSTLNFVGSDINPIFDVSASNFNVYQPTDSTLGLPVGLQPSLTDKRVPFYVVLSGAAAWRWQLKGFYGAPAAAVPVYLPGEMTLIKAESYTRQATPDLTNGLNELNKVVTKLRTADPFGVGAEEPAIAGPLTQAQLLDQIYRHRCIELYMSGLKLVDMRRFGRPNSERSRNLMPYPFRERDNNPNTPPDPTF